MSMDPHGILAYGYDLGGPEPGWKLTVPTPNDYGYVSEDKFHFMNPIEGLIETSWSERAKALLVLEWTKFEFISYKERDRRPPDYFKQLAEAERSLGISIERYGSSDYPGYILATTVFMADDWGAMEVRPDIIDHSAADILYRALMTLKIWPKQPEPRWILASYYG